MRKIPADTSGINVSEPLRPRRPGTRNPKDKSHTRGSQGERDGHFGEVCVMDFQVFRRRICQFFFIIFIMNSTALFAQQRRDHIYPDPYI